jgi:hypothetical protein
LNINTAIYICSILHNKKKVFFKKQIADGLGLGLDVQREQKNRKKRNI